MSPRGCIPALACALLAAFPGRAAAQACCAGASTLSPTRLTLAESWAVGLAVRGAFQAGQFDAGGRWSRASGAFAERDAGQDLFAVVRVRQAIQLGLLVPIVENYRAIPGLTDVGGGVGDVKATARFELVTPDDAEPGFALLAGASFPTGRAVEEALNPLAADATGAGAATALAGVTVEKPWDHLLLQLTATLQHAFARTAQGQTLTAGPQVAAFAAAGWVFDAGPGVAAVVSWKRDGEQAVNGVALPSSARRLTTVGLSGGVPLDAAWRVQGSVTAPLALDGLGGASPGAVAAQVAVIRGFL